MQVRAHLQQHICLYAEYFAPICAHLSMLHYAWVWVLTNFVHRSLLYRLDALMVQRSPDLVSQSEELTLHLLLQLVNLVRLHQ
jgi:hypothetical protein